MLTRSCLVLLVLSSLANVGRADDPPPCDDSQPAGWGLVDFDLNPTHPQLPGLSGHLFGSGIGFAERVGIGYEVANGFGIRGQFWGFDEDSITSAEGPAKMTASLFDLDLYRRFVWSGTELVIGGSPRDANLAFGYLREPSIFRFYSGYTHFSALGASGFTELRQTIGAWADSEINLVGKGRLSVVEGDWLDPVHVLGNSTNNDTMTILETSLGLEFRHRMLSNKIWYVAAAPEFQQWTSDHVTETLGGSLGFLGADIRCGINW